MQKTHPAQNLVYELKEQIPTVNQKSSLESILALFLAATGNIRIDHSEGKSASSLSRYLNKYRWSTKALWASIRRHQMETLLGIKGRGRPYLKVIVDLTSIEKVGKFPKLEKYMHTLHGVHGVHLVMVYLVIGKHRIPWNMRLWQGKGTKSPAKLALRMIKQLPEILKKQHRIIVLADAAYDGEPFLTGIKLQGYVAVVSMHSNRKLEDGRHLRDIRGTEKVQPSNLEFPVWATRFRLKGIKGATGQWRHVISTEQLSGKMIKRWGKRRWSIEAFFKTMKHRFGLHCFGQATLIGVYRWFLFSFLAFILAAQLHSSKNDNTGWPDWKALSASAIKLFLPNFLLTYLFTKLDQLDHLAYSFGFSLSLSNCKM